MQAPVVAEIYGPDYAGQMALAGSVRELFASTPDIVDVDDSVESDSRRLVIEVDRNKAALLGVSQAQVADVHPPRDPAHF